MAGYRCESREEAREGGRKSDGRAINNSTGARENMQCTASNIAPAILTENVGFWKGREKNIFRIYGTM